MIMSNMPINTLYEPYESVEDMIDFANTPGCNKIILLDEIQIMFNSLESAKLPVRVFDIICQQRKNKVTIIGTTQVFTRMSKAFREQCSVYVDCNNFWRFQHNKCMDAFDLETEIGKNFLNHMQDQADNPFILTDEKSGKKIGTQFFIHRKSDYEFYDTFHKISSKQKA